MLPWLREDFGNAASTSHVYGWRAEAAVEQARDQIARSIGAEASEIVFTSGATESNNLALLGAAEASRRRHIVTVATEHAAVLDPCLYLRDRGFEIDVLPVDAAGILAPDALAAVIRDDTLMVSVMVANNEIGVLQPIAELGAICRERGVLFHSDGAQAIGRVALDVRALGIDLLSISGHKLYGPKGVGALFVRGGRPRVRLAPRQHGGGHERGLRSGTLPVPLVVGLAEAMKLCDAERVAEAARLAGLRDRLFEHLAADLGEGVRMNGDPDRRLPGNLNVCFPGAEGEKLLLGLPDLALSTGSACSSARPEPSHVLRALGLPDDLVRGALRIGLGRGTTEADVDYAAGRIAEEVRKQLS